MPILFYDSSCGLCARSVQWVLAHERRRRTLRFAGLQGPRAAAIPKLRLQAAAPDSVVWYEEPGSTHPARVLTRSAAVLAVWRYVGGGWGVAAGIGRLLPTRFRDWVYDLVARHRHSLAGPACVVPAPDERDRFLDAG
jgi:predicted DCC family thiol-disulfide oxidoreductase YuxK